MVNTNKLVKYSTGTYIMDIFLKIEKKKVIEKFDKLNDHRL